MTNEENLVLDSTKEGTSDHVLSTMGSPSPPLNMKSRNDYLFDSKVEILSLDEEDDEQERQFKIHNSSSEHMGFPRVTLPKKLLEKIRKPWKNTLIIRLLGKTIGGLNAIDLGSNYFLFKFFEKSDYTTVFTGGPWVIMDHYLTVRRWEPNFKPSEAFETITVIWVRFPELPIEYYQETVLFAIAKTIDKPLKIDWNTTMVTRGKFARICVEMDVSQPLKSKFILEDRYYNIDPTILPAAKNIAVTDNVMPDNQMTEANGNL
ncbi:uncharacterized protein LOC114256416 [Camellia sinensis]|uniref:uncharacterized protein LOC114256416 n=1 Tax=Camellia sinensis TaxID=4442 RepID=UPI00103657DE|nr:uncharacterized protein LOC114256416 [Camellia sinensis]